MDEVQRNQRGQTGEADSLVEAEGCAAAVGGVALAAAGWEELNVVVVVVQVAAGGVAVGGAVVESVGQLDREAS